MSNPVVPFGKCKGQPVERMLEDKSYAEWLLAQDWFKNRFGPLYTVVINHGQEPVDTPEHNALQAKFLDFDFRVAFVKATVWHQNACDELGKRAKSSLADYSEAYREFNARADVCETKHCLRYRVRTGNLEGKEPCYYSACHWCWEPLRKVHYSSNCGLLPPLPRVRLNTTIGEPCFEKDFVDVIFTSRVHAIWAEDSKNNYSESNYAELRVEIKPAMGDDYPAVLRQCHKRHSTHVLCARYTGVGVPKDRVPDIFTASGIDLVWLDDLETKLSLQ